MKPQGALWKLFQKLGQTINSLFNFFHKHFKNILCFKQK